MVQKSRDRLGMSMARYAPLRMGKKKNSLARVSTSGEDISVRILDVRIRCYKPMKDAKKAGDSW